MNIRAAVGRIRGASVMFGFGLLWLLVGAYGGRPLPAWFRIAFWLVALILAAWIVTMRRRTTRFAKLAPRLTSEQIAAGRQIGRRNGLIFGLEAAAIAAAVLILNAVHQPQAIVLTVAIIVGLHFLPLARLFRVTLYYVTGVLGCLIGIVGFRIGDQPSRSTFVGVSFGLLLWITSVILLLQASQIDSQQAAIG